MSTTFEINNPPGAFRVFNSDGRSAFDSRYASQLILAKGVTDLQGRSTEAAPGGGVVMNPSAKVEIPYGQTFPEIPYVRSVSRKIGLRASDIQGYIQFIYPPYIRYGVAIGSTYLSYINGHFSSAGYSSLYLGNTDATLTLDPSVYNGTRRIWYAIFRNFVGG